MNKLSRKDIAMLEVLAVTEESKGKLEEYIQQQGKATKAYKAFREAVVNGVEVDKVEQKGNKFEVGDKALILRVTDELNARKGFFVGDEVTVTGYRDGILWKVSEDGANVIVRARDNIGFFREEELELVVAKPIKPKRKFKAGDKVRVLDTENPIVPLGLGVGDVTEVLKYSLGGVVVVKTPRQTGYAFKESSLELVEEKTPNELRAEIIEKAKLFLSEEKGAVFEFIIQDKRILVLNNEEKLFTESECHPGDVFNEHIGKAIALGRALGKDVSEFENAVQPNFEVGQTARLMPRYEGRESEIQIIKVDEDKLWFVNEFGVEMYMDTGVNVVEIIDDTNAIYGLCE